MGRVVIVDDDRGIRDLVRTRLERAGHEVVGEAATGRDAIGLAAALTPVAIVLDVMMPEMTGLEALLEIATVSPGSKVLMFSSIPSLTLADVLRLGAHGLLDKADQERLADEVNQLCQPAPGRVVGDEGRVGVRR